MQLRTEIISKIIVNLNEIEINLFTETEIFSAVNYHCW